MFCIPQRFGFTYVQTMLSLVFYGNKLFMKDLSRYSHLESMLVGLPVGLMGWLEATTCEFFMVYIGGHLMYDLSIHVFMGLYYVVASGIEKEELKKKNKIE